MDLPDPPALPAPAECPVTDGLRLPLPPLGCAPAPLDDSVEIEPAQASFELKRRVRAWVAQSLAHAGDGPAPRLAIRATTGLGKSRVTLRVLADAARGKNVRYHVPTINLALDLATDAERLGIPTTGLRRPRW